MKKHVRSWSKFPFWQAPTLYFPTVPTAPRWRNKSNARLSSWGWHYYYHYALWCDDENPKQTLKLQHRHTLPKHTDTAIYHFLLPRKDKFSLRDFALWGLHTPLSWELLWHNSCSLILPPHRSMGRRVPYSLFIHRWDVLYLCFSPRLTCVSYITTGHE